MAMFQTQSSPSPAPIGTPPVCMLMLPRPPMHTKHKKREIAWDMQVRSGERKKSVFEIMLEERDKASKLPERL